MKREDTEAGRVRVWKGCNEYTKASARRQIVYMAAWMRRITPGFTYTATGLDVRPHRCRPTVQKST